MPSINPSTRTSSFRSTSTLTSNAGLEKKVLGFIVEASKTPGKTINRRMLVWKVFGVSVNEQELNNNRLDRQIRQSIENLRLRGYPIISSAAGKGYTIISDRAEIEKMIAEMESRRESLADQIRALRNNYGLRPVTQVKPAATQPGLLS
jgi:hypothetical protein